MKKIIFNLEEFKKFLEKLDEIEYYDCSPIDKIEISYYLDETNGRIKVRGKYFMMEGKSIFPERNKQVIKIDNDYDDDITIRGKIKNGLENKKENV